MNRRTHVCLAAICLLLGCHRPNTALPREARAAAHPGRAAFQHGYGLILQGDLKAGLAILDPIPPEALGPADRASRQAILDQFKHGQSPALDVQDPFARDVAMLFQGYWTRCLLGTTERDAAGALLLTDLKACLIRHGKPGAAFQSLDDLTQALGPMLEAVGFHSLRGVTSPYYELMLWRREREATYSVRLPESTQRVRVVFMSDFVLWGWLGFATCGRSHSGGWTTAEALYCLENAYALDSEAFRVSYLAHEGQHFADNQRFPKLQQPELEYRAKLVEVIQAEETLYPLLEQFSRQGGGDRTSPHPFANQKLSSQLSRALFGNDAAHMDPILWRRKSREDLQSAALKLLQESTRTLESLGAGQVERLPF